MDCFSTVIYLTCGRPGLNIASAPHERAVPDR